MLLEGKITVYVETLTQFEQIYSDVFEVRTRRRLRCCPCLIDSGLDSLAFVSHSWTRYMEEEWLPGHGPVCRVNGVRFTMRDLLENLIQAKYINEEYIFLDALLAPTSLILLASKLGLEWQKALLKAAHKVIAVVYGDPQDGVSECSYLSSIWCMTEAVVRIPDIVVMCLPNTTPLVRIAIDDVIKEQRKKKLVVMGETLPPLAVYLSATLRCVLREAKDIWLCMAMAYGIDTIDELRQRTLVSVVDMQAVDCLLWEAADVAPTVCCLPPSSSVAINKVNGEIHPKLKLSLEANKLLLSGQGSLTHGVAALMLTTTGRSLVVDGLDSGICCHRRGQLSQLHAHTPESILNLVVDGNLSEEAIKNCYKTVTNDRPLIEYNIDLYKMWEESIVSAVAACSHLFSIKQISLIALGVIGAAQPVAAQELDAASGISPAGALALLGMIGSETVVNSQLTQLLDPVALQGVSIGAQMISGMTQPSIGPTFKLGFRLLTHTLLILNGAISADDNTAGVVSWYHPTVERLVTSQGELLHTRGSVLCEYISANVAAYRHDWDKMDVIKRPRHTHALISPTFYPYNKAELGQAVVLRMVISAWPLVLAVCMLRWLPSPVWYLQILQLLAVWLLMAARPQYEPNSHKCHDKCMKETVYIRVQQKCRALAAVAVCPLWLKSDLSHAGKPIIGYSSLMLRGAAGILLLGCFPAGLVYCTLIGGTSELIWAVIQVLGCFTGIPWWLMTEGRWSYMSGMAGKYEGHSTLRIGSWGDVVSAIPPNLRPLLM
jgi:hypothetical protein